MMIFVWICVGAVAGAAMAEAAGFVLGALIGYLLGTIRQLATRIDALEARLRLPRRMAAPDASVPDEADASPTSPATAASTDPPAQPKPTPSRPAAPPLTPAPTAAAAESTAAIPSGRPDMETPPGSTDTAVDGDPKRPVRRLAPVAESSLVDEAFDKVREWVLGGNPVTRIGLIVLFCGVAFLLKYAAARDLLPIELRLGGVLTGGIALVAAGWRLRTERRTYALLLQGGGIGVIYLTLFAAAKLYHLLPLILGLLLMLALVGFSAALAILQNALPLAQFGTMGGFLAPVLMSTGSGSHVLLFSYYALLNAGVFAIAWFRAWRSLNLTGFFFTFGIGSLWGAAAYAPRHFATTEPFLLLFFCFYVGISILYALRQPPRFKGLVDGSLVFGLPLVVFGLQSAMVHRYDNGLAFSALGLGAFYVLLAAALWRHHGVGLRMLVEAFLALGVVFASVAIPLGLDDQWTTAAWAMEGAALVWVGVRQERRLARWLGLLLQAGAGLFFVESLTGAAAGRPVINGLFLGGTLISAAGLFSGIYLHLHHRSLIPQERSLPSPVALWGLLWWLGMGVHEILRFAPDRSQAALIVGFVALSLFGLLRAYHRLNWTVMRYPLLGLLPLMGCLALWELAGRTLGIAAHGHLLVGAGLIAWPLAFALQYRILFEIGEQWPAPLTPYWHTGTLLLLTAGVAGEADWLLREVLAAGDAWRLAALMGILCAPLAILLRLQDRQSWPFDVQPRVYALSGWAPAILSALLWTLCLLAGLHNGDPHPLAYLPLFNPVDAGQLVILLLLATHLWRLATVSEAAPDDALRRALMWALAAAAFLFLNVLVARSVHHFGGVAYDHRLLADSRLHAAVSILWAVLALAAMAWGARHWQRPVWLAGAVLLGCGVGKLFFIDLAGSSGISRIVSFLAVGGLMLLIGFFAPLPPAETATEAPPSPLTEEAP